MSERFFSVDVETSGPIPGEFSLLTIGACVVDDETKTFSARLKPLNQNFIPAAMEVTGLSLDELERTGLAPDAAMSAFGQWVAECARDGSTPVFVGLNAPFDWGFINFYFHKFLGLNPFGFSALDIKALYMGATGCTWKETSSSQIAKRVSANRSGTHDALDDALYQAELFRLVRALPRR